MLFALVFLLMALCILTYKRWIYRLFINVILILIKQYLYIVDKICYILPTFIYIKSVDYRTLDTDFSIYEYWGKNNNRYNKFYTIEDNKYSSNDGFKIYNASNRMLINHCCVVNNDGVYIKDITNEIRKFMHYRGLIEWKYIIIHLNLTNDEKIIIYMNDIDMNEKIYDIIDIYDKKFVI